MSDVTIVEHHRYYLRQHAHKKQEESEQARTTPEQVWNAAYSFDPLNTPAGTVSNLQRNLSRRIPESVPLGRYGAMTYARLKPSLDIGPLPTTGNVEGYISLRYAATDSAAISYPDWQPSEFEESRFRTRSTEDQKLRRVPDWTCPCDGHGCQEGSSSLVCPSV